MAFGILEFSVEICSININKMEALQGFVLLQFLSSVLHAVYMNPAYLDLVKIVFGSTAWIGGLTLFMWIREKRVRHAVVA